MSLAVFRQRMERETHLFLVRVASEYKVSSRVIGMNPSIQTEARCYQVTMSHHSRRLRNDRGRSDAHLFDDVFSSHRQSGFARLFIEDSLKHDRRIACEHFYH